MMLQRQVCRLQDAHQMHSLSPGCHVGTVEIIVSRDFAFVGTEWTAAQVERALWSASVAQQASKRAVQGTKRKR